MELDLRLIQFAINGVARTFPACLANEATSALS